MWMKHIFLIIAVIAICIVVIFLPYMEGEYDPLAVVLSSIFQFANFASLLLIPVGLIWCIMDLVKRERSPIPKHRAYLGKTALVVMVIIILFASLGAFASGSRFSAIVVLLLGIYLFMKIPQKRKHIELTTKGSYDVTPYYFIFIPLAVFSVRSLFLETAKNKSTTFVIKQSEQLIQEIEAYNKINEHYPVSLQSTVEDYHPSIIGISRFQYELNGSAYNLYFEQPSDMVGTQEIVMYNKMDEHDMTVHNQDILRITPGNIIRGYHKVANLSQKHWKVFYFD